MTAEALSISFLYFQLCIVINIKAELAHEHKGLGGADNGNLGETEQDFFDGSAVIRLHVVNYQIVQLPSLQQIIHVFQKLSACGPVHGIEKDRLFIKQQIRIIRNTSGNGMDIFKQGKPVVIGTHPV